MKMLSEDQKKLVDNTYMHVIVESTLAGVARCESESLQEIVTIEGTRKAVREGLEKLAATFNAARDKLYNDLPIEDQTLGGRSNFDSMELHASVEGPIGEVPSLVILGVWGGLIMRAIPGYDGFYSVKRNDGIEKVEIEGLLEIFGKVLTNVHPKARRALNNTATARKKFPVAG